MFRRTSALLAVACLAASCGDDPVAPGGDTSAEDDGVSILDVGDDVLVVTDAPDATEDDDIADALAPEDLLDSVSEDVPDTTSEVSDSGGGDSEVAVDTGDVGSPDELTIAIVEPGAGADLLGTVTFEATATPPGAAVRFVWAELGVTACAAIASGGVATCDASVDVLATGDHTLVAIASVVGSSVTSQPVVVSVVGSAPVGTVRLEGTLTAPSGLTGTDYDVGNRHGADDVAADGTTSAFVAAPGVTLTVAERIGGGDADTNALLAVTVRGPGLPEPPLALSPESTAVALLFLHPAFAGRSLPTAIAVLETAPQIEGFDALVAAVDSLWGSAPNPLSDPAFLDAYDAAAAELALMVPEPALPAGGPVGDGYPIRWHALDHFRQLEPEYDAETGTLSVRSSTGMPLGSVIEVARIDLDRHGPDSELPLLSAAAFDRLANRRSCTPGQSHYPVFHRVDGTTQSGWTDAISLYTYLDVFGNVTALVVDTLVDLLLPPDGPDPGDDDFALSPSVPGAYVVRAFTGKLHTGAECGELAAVAGSFKSQHHDALVLNLSLLLTDYLGLFVDVEPYVDDCVGLIRDAVASGVPEGAIATQPDGSPPPATTASVFSVAATALSVAAQCIAGGLADDLEGQGVDGAVAKALKKGKKLIRVADELGFQTAWSKLDDFFDALGTVSAVGAALDRLAALVGNTGPTHLTAFTSPMDTILVRVGDPFRAEVVSIAKSAEEPIPLATAQAQQLLIRSSELLTLRGTGFRASPPGAVDLRFTDRAGRTAVARGTLTSPPASLATVAVAVPPGLAGVVALAIVGPGGEVALGEVLVIEPVLVRVAPSATFVPNFPGGPGYDPDVRIQGSGFDPNAFEVVLGGQVHLVDPLASSTTTLVIRATTATLAGSYPVTLRFPLGLSPALAAAYPSGEITSAGVVLDVLGPPVVTTMSPSPLGGGQRFSIAGSAFGEQLDAVQLVFADALKAPLPLHRLRRLPDGSASLTATLDRSFSPPFPTSADLILKTPAGEASFSVALGETPWPIHARTISVNDPSGWSAAWAFFEGSAQPAGSFARVPDPDIDPPTCSCIPSPEADGSPPWSYDLSTSPLPAITATKPPGRSGAGCCDGSCSYDSPFSLNQILGLPTSPCPATWSGVDAADIRDTLTTQPGAVTHLPGVELTLPVYRTLSVAAETGGGLVLRGLTGKRSHATIGITLDEATPGDSGVVLRLEDVDTATVTLTIGGAEPGACSTALELVNCRNVRVIATIAGCQNGVTIDGDSENIVVAGTITDYGAGGTGVWVRGAREVDVQVLARAVSLGSEGGLPSGAPATISEGAVGVRIDEGAEDVDVFFSDCTSNASCVYVGEASGVAVKGRIGTPPPFGGSGTVSPTYGNHVGVDLEGPANDVTIGGDPLQGVKLTLPNGQAVPDQLTVIANNGLLDPGGAGVRVRDVTGLVIEAAYIGLAPSFQSGLGNRVGVLLTAQPGPAATDVVLRRLHIGHNAVAGVQIDGVDGVELSGVLFAGPRTADWATGFKPPHTTGAPAIMGGLCQGGAVPAAFNAQLPTGYGDATGPGLAIVGAEDVVVRGTVFIGHHLEADDASRLQVLGSTVIDAAGPGLELSACHGAVIDGIDVWRNGGPGIRLAASTNVAIGGCVAGNAVAGVEVTDESDEPGDVRAGRLLLPTTSAPTAHPGSAFAALPPRPPAAGALVVFQNQGPGIWLHDGATPFTLAGATVAGNAGSGMHLDSWAAPVAVVASHLGAGDGALDAPNLEHGIWIDVSDGPVHIGQPGAGNTISGNSGDGIRGMDSADVKVVANAIGLLADGSTLRPNGGDGIHTEGVEDLVIGGPRPDHANLVGGNVGDGIVLVATGVLEASVIENNRVGVDASGLLARGNGGDGVSVSECDTDTGAPRIVSNLIGSNGGVGVMGEECRGVVVDGNAIGSGNLPAPGAPPAPLPNKTGAIAFVRCDDGIVTGSELVGEAGQPVLRVSDSRDVQVRFNTIRAGTAGIELAGCTKASVHHNGVTATEVGVRLIGGDANTLRTNRITGHSGKGISLAAGANGLIPRPEILSAVRGPDGRWTFSGRVAPVVPDGALVEVFADEVDEARVPLGLTTVTGGRWLLRGIAEPAPAVLAPAISLEALAFHATVTDRAGRTSELGDLVPAGTVLPDLPGCEIPGPAPLGTLVTGALVVSGPGGLLAYPLNGGAATPLSGVPGGGAAACGDRVVVSRGPAGEEQLILIEGGVETALAPAAGSDVEPAFAPECENVVFASNRGGKWDLYSVHVSGADLTPLTDDAEEDRWPAVSPDGTTVYSRRAGTGRFELHTVLGTSKALLAADTGADLIHPAPHPSAPFVAAARCGGDVCGLVVVDSETGTTARIDGGSCDDRRPGWHDDPLGTWLTFSRAKPGASVANIVVASEQGYPLWSLGDGELPACCLD